MLTADLVRTRVRGGELSVVELNDKSRARALELAEAYHALVQNNFGASYGELKEGFAGVEVGPREKKLAQGLRKLLEDELELDSESPVEPRLVRSAVFLTAAESRRDRPHEFERERVFESARQSLAQPDVSLQQLEAALYADLKSEQRVQPRTLSTPTELVTRYNLAQYQAVLLRATAVRARVRCASPAGYRDLFRALKFRRLLYTLEPSGLGYRLDIDGPFSLFESVTKYGVQLALLFPALLACDELEFEADVRWGKERTPLTFRYHGQVEARKVAPAPPPPEIDELVRRVGESGTGWTAQPNDRVLDLPGVGAVIPDLVFTREGQTVYFELLGYWSRAAVWKRVELVRRGFEHKIVFALSSRLRVSEEVLDEADDAALLVFKGALSVKRALAKVTAVASR
jgi:hypothetical protein